jgi:hypothetical protein
MHINNNFSGTKKILENVLQMKTSQLKPSLAKPSPDQPQQKTMKLHLA